MEKELIDALIEEGISKENAERIYLESKELGLLEPPLDKSKNTLTP